MNEGGDAASRIRRSLDDYAATRNSACILSDTVDQDAASLLSAGFADQADEDKFRFLADQLPLLARLFWQRFLSRDAVHEGEPMASVRVTLARPQEADKDDSPYEMALSVGGDLAATQDLVAALWLYATMWPERVDDVPEDLQPLWRARRDLSERRFWWLADQITHLLEEFDNAGDPESARRALYLVTTFQHSPPGIMFHLSPRALSRYILLYCDALVCWHTAGGDSEALEAALSGLGDGLAQGTIRDQDRLRAAEIIMRTMTGQPGWTSRSPGAAHAAMEMLRDITAASRVNADRERATVLLGKLLMFWSEHDQNPELLDQAIDLLRQSRARAAGTTEHFPVLWGLHIALTRRFTRNGDPEDQTAADDVLMALATAPPAEAPETLDQNLLLAAALEERFDRVGDVPALVHAFDRYRAAWRQLDDDDDTETLRAVLTRCSLLLVLFFEETGDPNAASAAVDAAERALDVTPRDSPDYPGVLASYGGALGTLAAATGDRSALLDFTGLVRSALAGATSAELPEHDRADLFAALARALRDIWDGTGDHALLPEALRAARTAISLGTETIRRDSLLSLAGSMLACLADIDGDIGLLNEGIAMQRAALGESEAAPGHPGTIENLALALFRKYLRTSDRAALEEACIRQFTAVSRSRQTSSRFPDMVSNLASMMSCWVHSDHSEIMCQVVNWQRQVVASCRPDAPNRIRYMASLSLSLLDLAGRLPESEGTLIDEAIAVAESALGACAGKDTDLQVVKVLAQCYLRRADDPEGPGRAIALLRDFAAQDGRTERPGLLFMLGLALMAEHGRTGNPSPLEPAQEMFKQVALTPSVGAERRVDAAKRWGAIADALGDVRSACDGYSVAVSLLDLLAWRGLGDDDQKRLLADQMGLARTAAAFAIECQEYERAVELLEQGRGILLGRLTGEAGHEALHDIASELAERLRSVQAHLDNLPDRETHVAAPGPARTVGDVRAELAQEHAALVAAVRNIPGWQEFLQPPAYSTLAGAVTEGPVIMLNTSAVRCDALIVTSHGVRAIPLPAVTEENLYSHAKRFLIAVEALALTGVASDHISVALELRNSVTDVLEWLWDAVAEPALTALEQLAPGMESPGTPADTPARLWWCPSGNLALLPLHAAGRYRSAVGDEHHRTSVLDWAISSYTPTLRSLLGTGARIPVQPQQPLLIAVSPPEHTGLLGVDRDVETFRSYFPRGRVLRDDEATAAEALNAMAESDWVQFTCHAQTDFTDPFNSGVILADRLATAREMRRSHGQAASTALLLGCTTGRTALGDEMISLATTLRAAGFAHVVGTLWPVDDQDASFVAEHILQSIAADRHSGADRRAMASLVHAAVRALRDKVPHAPSRWSAFMHVGG